MVFLWQRSQRFAEQPKLADANRKLPFLGTDNTAAGANDVTDIPVLELLEKPFGQVVTLDHQLDRTAAVLHEDKSNFPHHPLGHHAPGQ